MDRFVILSGCSGGGKSTLLAALAARGHATVAEPGRRIVAAEIASGGSALPWIDLAAFARRAMDLALEDRERAKAFAGRVFFDRGLVDAAAALHHATGEDVLSGLARAHRSNRLVFLTPPWPEIYRADPERRHGFDEAVAEYERLIAVYPALGYEPVVLPRVPIEERVDFVVNLLGPGAAP